MPRKMLKFQVEQAGGFAAAAAAAADFSPILWQPLFTAVRAEEIRNYILYILVKFHQLYIGEIWKKMILF